MSLSSRGFVVYSDNMSLATAASRGFWSNESGWVSFASASLFTSEIRGQFPLRPPSAEPDAQWLEIGAPLLGLCLFHVTARTKLACIAREGMRRKSYWSESGGLPGYYEEAVEDEGEDPVTLAVFRHALKSQFLEPDYPGIEEPITTVVGKSENEIHNEWSASDQKWHDSLTIVGSLRYREIIPVRDLFVLDADDNLAPLSAL
ncbi:hypothetical protein A9R05_44265 (plasmid) [Burkholderia sp. KK1]|uniref:Uncharacterized protein n=1 Tax=Burkholderia sp. M701 TaxID=326454 RepID=V5YPF9_9BURK|nr:hypothetical protein [Burkholderia sp. M701]AQH05971.1 hypothetical protein A9R05_44265 [Burkholderia sp. KK1]BAO19203.1 hypothetical protein [Burkholderia sp. M701]